MARRFCLVNAHSCRFLDNPASYYRLQMRLKIDVLKLEDLISCIVFKSTLRSLRILMHVFTSSS